MDLKGGNKAYDPRLGRLKQQWLPAVWLIANSKNGISSHELARSLGITQKSAWFMLHRIRLAMQAGSFDRMDGEVEVDETFIGGKARNMHLHKRKAKFKGGRGAVEKTTILGMRQRGGELRAQVVPHTSHKELLPPIRENVERGSAIYTDALKTYRALSDEYTHQVVDHAEAYVDGRVHTNGLENFWALLKRGLHGTYVSVEPFHLFRYLDERCFTYNMRELSDLGRFTAVLSQVAGRRLTWHAATGKA